MMNKRPISVSILAMITSLLTACGTWAVVLQSEEPAAPKAVMYQTLLGKSLSDTVVADFIIDNNCSSVDQFQFCKEIGMALWIDSNLVVETVYLYLNGVEGMQPYEGKLPYGLKFYDIKEAVEYKLKKQGVGKDGLPDEGGSPDRMHYWATYKEAGMTVVYNSPFSEDEDATIYAILLSE